MSRLIRFGVSIEERLLKKFDKLLRKQYYKNRSEALRDLIRSELIKEEWLKKGKITGGIAFVYNHHKRQLVNNLLDVQHDHQDIVVSSQHVHLDHDNCLEIVIVKGESEKVRNLFFSIKALKGVKHVDILKSTTGSGIE